MKLIFKEYSDIFEKYPKNDYYLKFFSLLYDEFGDKINLINKLLEKEPDYLPAIKQKYTILSQNF